jgi:hypothetical protein
MGLSLYSTLPCEVDFNLCLGHERMKGVVTGYLRRKWNVSRCEGRMRKKVVQLIGYLDMKR